MSCGKSCNWLHSLEWLRRQCQELPGNCFLSICNVDWPPPPTTPLIPGRPRSPLCLFIKLTSVSREPAAAAAQGESLPQTQTQFQFQFERKQLELNSRLDPLAGLPRSAFQSQLLVIAGNRKKYICIYLFLFPSLSPCVPQLRESLPTRWRHQA